MLVKLDITGCKTDDEISEVIENKYPWAGYMPIRKGFVYENSKTYMLLEVLSNG